MKILTDMDALPELTATVYLIIAMLSICFDVKKV